MRPPIQPHLGTFGLGFAIDQLKSGRWLRRANWPLAEFLFLEDHPIIRLTGENAGLRGAPVHQAICLHTAEGEIIVGWTPTQADMLSSDWQYYEKPESAR